MPQPSRKNYFGVAQLVGGERAYSGKRADGQGDARRAVAAPFGDGSFYTAGPKPAIRDALLSLGLKTAAKRENANG